ncbi:hypothetical protein SDC9_180673 [bioreactor metagenome]|uniref:Uncharacterized protein n=1 Tax=bioreactor metagenome TaxID=1076179 RepID=A0A645H571_9ZZZZ
MDEERVGHAHPSVADTEAVADRTGRFDRRNFLHQQLYPAALGCELDGVAQQVDQNLVDAQRVAVKIRVADIFRPGAVAEAIVRGLGRDHGVELAEQVGNGNGGMVEGDL